MASSTPSSAERCTALQPATDQRLNRHGLVFIMCVSPTSHGPVSAGPSPAAQGLQRPGPYCPSLLRLGRPARLSVPPFPPLLPPRERFYGLVLSLNRCAAFILCYLEIDRYQLSVTDDW